MDPHHGLGFQPRRFFGVKGICCRSTLGAFVHYLFLGNDTWHKIEMVSHQTFLELFIPTCLGVFQKHTWWIERTVLFRCNQSCYRVWSSPPGILNHINHSFFMILQPPKPQKKWWGLRFVFVFFLGRRWIGDFVFFGCNKCGWLWFTVWKMRKLCFRNSQMICGMIGTLYTHVNWHSHSKSPSFLVNPINTVDFPCPGWFTRGYCSKNPWHGWDPHKVRPFLSRISRKRTHQNSGCKLWLTSQQIHGNED